MIKTIKIFIFLISIGVFTLLQAQDPKAVRKEWAKKMKEMDPLEFKRIIEEGQTIKSELAAKNNSLTDAQNEINQKNEQIASLKKTLDSLKNDHSELHSEHMSYKNSVQTATAPQKNTIDATANNPQNKEVLYKGGVIFKVQIGAFKNKDLTKYFENNKNFSGDIDPDGIKKYTLGYFNDYWEAENFKKYIREMGVKDAWIVAYKNGKRVNIRDVLEGLL